MNRKCDDRRRLTPWARAQRPIFIRDSNRQAPPIRHWFSFDEIEQIPAISEPQFQAAFGDELLSLPPADLACYAYGMVNRQDALYSPGSSEIGRQQFPAEIIFDGTKLPVDRSRPKTTTDGRICYFQLYSISQNCARRRLPVAADG